MAFKKNIYIYIFALNNIVFDWLRKDSTCTHVLVYKAVELQKLYNKPESLVFNYTYRNWQGNLNEHKRYLLRFLVKNLYTTKLHFKQIDKNNELAETHKFSFKRLL